MLSRELTFILDLLREALSPGPDLLLPWRDAAPDAGAVAGAICRNGILLTVYPRLSDFPEIRSRLSGKYYAALTQSVAQDAEGRQILQALDKAGIDCMPLKGWELRELYPQPHMRQMSDLDILVREYDHAAVKDVLAGLGYAASGESSWKHDNFTKGAVTVEMHKRLTDDSDAIRAWERGVWERAVPSGEGGHVLRMSGGDQAVFHLVHMHKDFLNGSLGLRRIADTRLLLRALPEVDRSFAAEELGRMGLGSFAERMDALSRTALGESEPDPNSEILLSHAFRYGIYGSHDAYKLGRIASKPGGFGRGKAASLLSAVFLPYSRMKAHYPALEERPALLPWFWAKRIAGHLRGDMRRNRQLLDYGGLKKEDYEQMKRFFEAGGV